MLPLVLLTAPLLAQRMDDVPYPMEPDRISCEEYRERRMRLETKMTPGAVAVFFTNPERNRNNDVDFRFRGDSNFLYLTGFEEPDAALLLAPGGVVVDGKRTTEVLFVNDRDPGAETWTGYRMGPERAPGLTGVACTVSNRRFADVVASLGHAVPTKATLPEGATGSLRRMVGAYTSWAGDRESAPTLIPTLSRMRAVKSPAEVHLIARAADASVRGHREAWRACRPGVWEYQIQAAAENAFTRAGCEAVAYPSIVGSGPNSCILHYEADRRQTKAGEIVCMDAAGEYHGYAADVTRTFPVSGRFSREQRAVYDLVLAAQDAGVAACRSGAAFRAPHEAARKVLEAGMTRLGIIADPKELRRYFMHGTSHTVGLDVHDTPISTLEPGVVLTVEPGLYIPAGSPCDPKWWNIGVRIEDDVLVTTGPPVNLSVALPRRAEEIERWMANGGAPRKKPA